MTTGGTEPLAIHEVVESFSDRMTLESPTSPIVQGLAAAVRDGEDRVPSSWSIRYQENKAIGESQELAKLNYESKLLNEKWCEFLETMKEKDSKSSVFRFEVRGGAEPTIDDVLDAAQEARKEWVDKKRLGVKGKNAQDYLHKFTGTLNAHSYFFSMLPTQNQYCAIFCGAVKTLLKASINHIKTAEGLTRALCDISTDISLTSAEAELINTKQMYLTVGQYYSHIFLFLKDAMIWFQSKWYSKIRTSFNESFYDDFAKQIINIKDISGQISRIMKIGNAAETRDIRLALEDIRLSLRDRDRQLAEADHWKEIYRQQMEQQQKEMKELVSVGFKKIAGQEMQHLLKQMVVSHQGNHFEGTSKPIVRQLTTRVMTIEDDGSSQGINPKQAKGIQDATYSSQDILQYSKHIAEYIYPSVNFAELIDPSDCYVEYSISTSLASWTTSTNCEMLWIEGLYETTYPSSTSTLAVAIVSAGQNSKALIPIISFFCPDPNNEDYDSDVAVENMTPDDRAESLLIDLTYSMIWQLLHLLPQTIKTKIDLSENRLSTLGGTMDTWRQTLSLLSDLLSLSPPLLLLVIDGIEHLDNTSIEHELRQLLRMIQDIYLDVLDQQEVASPMEDDDKNRVLKVLFTTAGSSEALNELDLDVMETVRATPSKSKHSPLRIRAGRERLTPFGDD